MNKLKYFLGVVAVLFLTLMAGYIGYRLAFRNLIYPNVKVAGVAVGGMNRESAMKLVNEYFTSQKTWLVLEAEGKEEQKINEIAVERDFVWAVDQAIGVGRNGNFLTQITEQIEILFSPREIAVPISYNEDDLSGYLDELAESLDKKPVWPRLADEGGKTVLVSGRDGLEVKKESLRAMVVKGWSMPGRQTIAIPREIVSTKEGQMLVEQALGALNKWGEKKLTLKRDRFETTLSKNEMTALFGLVNEVIDEDQFETLLARVQQMVESEPKDALFVFEEGKVKEFNPEVVGVEIDIPKFNKSLGEALVLAENEVLEIPVILTSPKIKTGDINNLGIKELIGEGKSSFAHSIPGRVFNINLASSKINRTLVPPGEEFSFNKTVGDISRASGYQSAYIISGGKTVLGDGGGVCQVSTTLFRAALNAGLPITERKAHAYRVGYYEQDSKPGLDATVFSPSADLKFLNNTNSHLLIQTSVDTVNLTMKIDIYGTKDGRVATVSEPKISSQSPAPATQYVDDPTLPAGQLKQIDWSASGAKVSFEYKVFKGEDVMFEKTFYSNYQPWRAVYLRGTKI